MPATTPIAHLEDRMLHLEREFADFREKSVASRAAIREEIVAQGVKIDTAAIQIADVKSQTTAIKNDTSDIVTLLKGMKVLGSLMKWFGGPGILGTGLYFLGKGRWW